MKLTVPLGLRGYIDAYAGNNAAVAGIVRQNEIHVCNSIAAVVDVVAGNAVLAAAVAVVYLHAVDERVRPHAERVAVIGVSLGGEALYCLAKLSDSSGVVGHAGYFRIRNGECTAACAAGQPAAVGEHPHRHITADRRERSLRAVVLLKPRYRYRELSLYRKLALYSEYRVIVQLFSGEPHGKLGLGAFVVTVRHFFVAPFVVDNDTERP